MEPLQCNYSSAPAPAVTLSHIREMFHLKTHAGEKSNKFNQCDYASSRAFWGDIWKHTVGKSQTNAANATMHPLRQAIWGDIWKHTVENRWRNLTSVTIHLGQVLWGFTSNTEWRKFKRSLCFFLATLNITLKSHLYIAYKQKGKQMIHVTRVTNKQMAKRMRFYLFISFFWFQLLFVVTSVCLFHLSCVFIFLCLFLLLFLFVYVSQDHLQTIIIAFLRPKRRACFFYLFVF